MSEQDRDGIRHTIAHLAQVAINHDAMRGGLVSDDEREKFDEATVRDAIRALANLATGFLCDVNRIADSQVVIASPPAFPMSGVVSVDGQLSADQVKRIQAFAEDVAAGRA